MSTPNPLELDTNILSILHQNPNQSNTSSPSLPPPPSTHHHHLQTLNSCIITRSLPSQGLSFQLWPAAVSFLSFLDLSPSPPLPPSSRILELGSGTGLLGIAFSALLPAHVTLTDLPHVLPNLRFNADANAALVAARGGSLAVRRLRWGVAEDVAEILSGGGFDAVVASDVVYYDHLIRPLLETVGALVKGEVVFLMAHLRRWRRRDAVFFRRAKRLFEVSVVHADPPAEGSRTGVCIYRFEARRSEVWFFKILD